MLNAKQGPEGRQLRVVPDLTKWEERNLSGSKELELESKKFKKKRFFQELC